MFLLDLCLRVNNLNLLRLSRLFSRVLVDVLPLLFSVSVPLSTSYHQLYFVKISKVTWIILLFVLSATQVFQLILPRYHETPKGYGFKSRTSH